MTFNIVKTYFENIGLEDRIKSFEGSCATVEEAAKTIGVIPSRIAKTLTLRKDSNCIMLVMAGNAGIDNKKFKNYFNMKARMLSADEVQQMTGQTVGGVCPFAIPENVDVYVDKSIQQYETLFPACGSPYHVVELSPDEIFQYGKAKEWVDVCKEK
ncbi:YbaK/aminoacyl-tRNA ligase-associated domain-containing protein [[Clostridium] sordellii]|uniref:YbaK/aminoacyl-tRNA ligase-associated domain-containing protein n=1 Tax=Paraclostridium sordellii TaxID=1505 RepID=A0A0C7R469_PARSO|nr:YbaK/EbsC family protein [Paeniclostridium sordellii]CEQ02959.1 YbaK/aminoacyl-tRNA ligase-associated domain-containing protein [[Clostridium] sordellii] [Paeniclostridium sordellii]